MDISTGWPSLISTRGYIHGYIHGYPWIYPWISISTATLDNSQCDVTCQLELKTARREISKNVGPIAWNGSYGSPV